MTWKDCWYNLACTLVFLVYFGGAAFSDDPVKANARRVHGLCWLGLGMISLAFKVLRHLEIIIPARGMP